MASIRACIPNSITCLNLLSGAVACIMALTGPDRAGALTGWQWASLAMAAAAVFDFLDGAVARLLGAYSAVGKELDSLSDLVSFGLAPALLVYSYIGHSVGHPYGWSFAALWIAVAGALRLARFNVDDRQTTSFIGLPIPANALFWIGMVNFCAGYGFPGVAPMLILVAAFPLLMVSNLRIFSLKFHNFTLRDNWRRYTVLVAAALLLIFCGVPGLAWAILFYIALALLPAPDTAE